MPKTEFQKLMKLRDRVLDFLDEIESNFELMKEHIESIEKDDK